MVSSNQRVAYNDECAGILGFVFGHRMVVLRDFRRAADLGAICARCGLAVWAPARIDGKEGIQ